MRIPSGLIPKTAFEITDRNESRSKSPGTSLLNSNGTSARDAALKTGSCHGVVYFIRCNSESLHTTIIQVCHTDIPEDC